MPEKNTLADEIKEILLEDRNASVMIRPGILAVSIPNELAEIMEADTPGCLDEMVRLNDDLLALPMELGHFMLIMLAAEPGDCPGDTMLRLAKENNRNVH